MISSMTNAEWSVTYNFKLNPPLFTTPYLFMDRDTLLTLRNNGINWFYWITGLSLINTCMNVFDGWYGFIVWLGYTQFIDGLVLFFRDEGDMMIMTIVFFISILVSGFFALAGYLTSLDKRWWYITAMVLYVIDMATYFYVQDYVGIWFHIFALYFIYRGYIAHLQLMKNP